MPFRKAMILSLSRDQAEMEELLYSLGIEPTATIVQRRPRPDPQSYLGRGKLEEAREAARAMDLDLIVVDAELRPGQVFAIESFFNEGRGGGSAASRRREKRFEVYDRVRVILEIFKDRARSPEARLQVELAELRYQIPIVKEFVHLSKMGERPGFLAGGSYGVEDELDMMRARMARIRHDLSRIRAERAVRRKHRRRAGFSLVALAGYTNAGKSSLLRALAGEDVLVENRYFSTLSTRTGRVETIRGRDVLMTDTVGFIEDLPPWIIEAFHATLEEISLSDVILLVLDASDSYDEVVRRLKTSERILARFEASSVEGAPTGLPQQPSAPQVATPGSARDAGRGMRGDERAAPADQTFPDNTDPDNTDLHPARAGDVPWTGLTENSVQRGEAAPAPHAMRAPEPGAQASRAQATGVIGAGTTASDVQVTGMAGASTRVSNSQPTGGEEAESTSSIPPSTSSIPPSAETAEQTAPLRAGARDLPRSAHGLGVILVVFNKRDMLAPGAFEALVARLQAEGHLHHPWAAVSARTGEGLEALSEAIVAALPRYDALVVEARHVHGGAALLAWLYEHAEVRHLASDDAGFRAEVLVPPARRSALLERAAAARGVVSKMESSLPPILRPDGAARDA